MDPRTLVATSVFEGEVGYLAVAQWLSSLAASGHGACSGSVRVVLRISEELHTVCIQTAFRVSGFGFRA